MARLNPEKLHVIIQENINNTQITPRRYTLTHSDFTGELFLTIGEDYDYDQISSLYIRFMRDEVLAEWQKKNDHFELHVYVYVSGGFIFGWASLRNKIIRNHLPLVLEVIRFGDQDFLEKHPLLKDMPIIVHFQSHKKRFNTTEKRGCLKDYSL